MDIDIEQIQQVRERPPETLCRTDDLATEGRAVRREVAGLELGRHFREILAPLDQRLAELLAVLESLLGCPTDTAGVTHDRRWVLNGLESVCRECSVHKLGAG